MLNVVAIVGRLVADPQMRQTTTGKNVASLRVAVDRGRRDPNGQSQADFFDVVAWDRSADFVCKYFQKGSPIVVEGSIQTRMWEDKAGQKRKSVEIVAENVEFVPRSKDAGAPSFHTERNEFAPPIAEPAPVIYSAGSADDFTVIDDEDLPF